MSCVYATRRRFTHAAVPSYTCLPTYYRYFSVPYARYNDLTFFVHCTVSLSLSTFPFFRFVYVAHY